MMNIDLLFKAFSKKKSILLLSILVLGALATAFGVYTTKAYEVRIDDKYIGVVKTKDDMQNIMDEVINRAEARYGTKISVPNQISYKSVFLAGDKKISDAAFQSIVESSITLNAGAFAINVDGRDIAFLKDRRSAEDVLNKIKAPYLQDGEDIANVGFLEDVSVVGRNISPDMLEDPDKVFNEMILESEHIKKYTVQEGDTVTAIAGKYELRVKDIQKANPGMDIDKISIGQELKLTVPRYLINVKKSTYSTSEEKIPFEVEYEDTRDLYKGDKKVKVKGEEGLKLVKTELVSINGILEETNIIEETVLEAPKTEIMLRGTKERPRTVATGVLQKPSRGSVSSYFGERWSEHHTGIDIAVPKGTPNKAADGGVVIFAGWDGNYGKLVIIDHENGFTTYYAHNDTITVKKGQRVAKGDVIGTAGTTGRTTGPHLHFEVRKNGSPVDPLKYIR